MNCGFYCLMDRHQMAAVMHDTSAALPIRAQPKSTLVDVRVIPTALAMSSGLQILRMSAFEHQTAHPMIPVPRSCRCNAIHRRISQANHGSVSSTTEEGATGNRLNKSLLDAGPNPTGRHLYKLAAYFWHAINRWVCSSACLRSRSISPEMSLENPSALAGS